MRIKMTVLTTMLFVFAFALPVQAAEWAMDKAHSAVYFDVKHILSTTRGAFTDFDASIDFDPMKPEAGMIMVTIKSTSINTGITKRDNHLRSKDFFEVGEYPEMVFTSTSIKHDGANSFVVTGDILIKGKSHKIMVPMIFHPAVPSPVKKGQEVAGMDCRFTLDRLAVGIGDGKFHKMGVVAKDVEIFVTLELTRDK